MLTLKRELVPAAFRTSVITLSQVPYTGVGGNTAMAAFLFAVSAASWFVTLALFTAGKRIAARRVHPFRHRLNVPPSRVSLRRTAPLRRERQVIAAW